MSESLQIPTKPVSSAAILRRLAEMAERLELTSNQAILLYAGNNFWLNAEWCDASVAVLKKLADRFHVDLFDLEEPFIVTLCRRGVFTEDEQRIFGWEPPPRPAPRTDANGNDANPSPKPTRKRRA